MSEPSLDDLIEQRQLLSLREKAAKDQREEVDQLILAKLAEAGVAQAVTKSGHKVTRVEGQRRTWKINVLRDILAPRGLWAQVRILREELDKDQLTLLLDAGQVSEEELAPALEVADLKPYPKITTSRPRTTSGGSKGERPGP